MKLTIKYFRQNKYFIVNLEKKFTKRVKLLMVAQGLGTVRVVLVYAINHLFKSIP